MRGIILAHACVRTRRVHPLFADNRSQHAREISRAYFLSELVYIFICILGIIGTSMTDCVCVDDDDDVTCTCLCLVSSCVWRSAMGALRRPGCLSAVAAPPLTGPLLFCGPPTPTLESFPVSGRVVITSLHCCLFVHPSSMRHRD